MKQLLFLLLFPCLAMAQYQGNGNQKITLGEQTSADGLVFRGLASDTTRKPSVDTMAFILLDTNTNIIWQYKKAVNNAWTRVGGSISSGVTGVLPVANGGTNTSTAFTAGSVVFAGASGTYAQDNANLFFDNTNKRLGIGTASPNYKLDISGTVNTSLLALRSSTSPSSNDFVGIDFGTGNSNGSLPNRSSRILGFADGANDAIGLSFYTSNGAAPTEKMRITSSGNVGIGTASPSSSLTINGTTPYIRLERSGVPTWEIRQNLPSTEYGFQIVNVTSASIPFFVGNSNNVGIGTTSPQSGYRLHVVDSVYVGGNVSASAYTTRSDYDLKDEIQNISYGINEVMQMQPVKYTYKSNGSTQLGFIAQDLGVITPEVVSFEDKMSVYYNALIPILTKAIQEQQALIKALEQRLLILENK